MAEKITEKVVKTEADWKKQLSDEQYHVTREAGTIVVPGHGRLCDQYDVVEYRDMVTIIRDRVRDLIKAGRSLAEAQAAQPAKGYVGRYGNQGGEWTTERFVEAIYRSLAKEKS